MHLCLNPEGEYRHMTEVSFRGQMIIITSLYCVNSEHWEIEYSIYLQLMQGFATKDLKEATEIIFRKRDMGH